MPQVEKKSVYFLCYEEMHGTLFSQTPEHSSLFCSYLFWDASLSCCSRVNIKCKEMDKVTVKSLLCVRLRSQGKLVKYFSRQLSCKCKVALEERSAELEDFPRLGHWFRIVNLRKEVTQVNMRRLLQMMSSLIA